MTAPSPPPKGPATHDSAGNLLPAILCLHGSGSNSTVYKIQARRILWTLSQKFRFVFVEAPHECPPGAGMVPVFESCAPFHKWVPRSFILGEDDKEIPSAEEVDMVDALLKKTVEENGGADSFVGIMGFSQGARLSAGLLIRQKMATRDGADCWTKFKFGVMVGGPFPPIIMNEGGVIDVEEDYALLRTIPTVVAWGNTDWVKEGAAQMADMCAGEHSFSMEFEGGHHFPLKEKEANELVDYIKAAWNIAKKQ